jgi:DNA polymerase zeta
MTGLDLSEMISRAPGAPTIAGTDQWGLRKTSTVKITGRHVLNLWRIMRSEQSLTVYTYENSVFHLLHRRLALSLLTPYYC